MTLENIPVLSVLCDVQLKLVLHSMRKQVNILLVWPSRKNDVEVLSNVPVIRFICVGPGRYSSQSVAHRNSQRTSRWEREREKEKQMK